MIHKKYILLFLFLGLLPFSCFRAKYPYYVIDSIIPEAYKDAALTKKIIPTDTLTHDSLYVKLSMHMQYTAQKIDFSFTSRCMATKKELNGERGLKDPIKEVIFSSNKLFNGRPANSSLNDLLILRTYSDSTNFTEMPRILNSLANYPNKDVYVRLHLTERPNDSLLHLFTLQFIHTSGTSIFTQFKVNWK